MSRTLNGLRLVVSGYELEQQEHRGIAVFSKGLLRALKHAGAEIWLLSEFEPPMQDTSRADLPHTVGNRIAASRTLDYLNSFERFPTQKSFINRILTTLPVTKQLLKLSERLKRLKRLLFPRSMIRADQLRLLPKDELKNSPYGRSERLAYLKYVDGLICANNCFEDSILLAKKPNSKKLRIDLQGFDGLITTSPQNLEPLNTDIFIQTVHDLIPLDYQRTRDHLPCFTRRLQAAGTAKRLFVSNDAKDQYNLIIFQSLSRASSSHRVITQSPSLDFPGDALDWEARMKRIRILTSDGSKIKSLKPCQYLLFNSSVVPHKNLLFVLNAFLESGLEESGIHFCITGKPQNDPYSDEVRRAAASHSSVIFTGYVDEATKRHLYLNALALVSPSLIEGFGIPVLDAACLGISAIASPLGSHKEIKAMHDFNNHVLLCSTLNSSDWASAMRMVGLRMNEQLSSLSPQRQINLLNRLRQERIQRYRRLQASIDQQFRETLCELITEPAWANGSTAFNSDLTRTLNSVEQLQS